MHHLFDSLPGTGVVGLEGGAEGFRVLGLDAAAFLLFSVTALLVRPLADVGVVDGVSFLLGFDTTNVTSPSVLFSSVAACKFIRIYIKSDSNVA